MKGVFPSVFFLVWGLRAVAFFVLFTTAKYGTQVVNFHETA